MTRISVRIIAPSSSLPRLSMALALSVLGAAACGSSTPTQPSTTAAEVAGAADMHCGTPAVPQTIGVCLTNDPPASTAGCGVTFQPDTGTGGDAGAPPDDGGTTSDYGDTMYNATGYDDDCKYKISWTATPVKVGSPVTFTVTATLATDGTAVHCASMNAEAFMGNTPAIPPPSAAETGSSGTYAVGPIAFTQSGMWTVRFHLFEECNDTPADSPHGHAAFYVMVP
jgi:hypothetical protein